MKLKGFLLMAALIMSLFLVSSASADIGASILYQETNVAEGLWQYDYTFNNTSTNEYLYSVRLFLGGTYLVADPTLADGWIGSWGKISPTSLLRTYTSDSSFHIAPGGYQEDFSFTVNNRLGDIAYTAYFDNHNGGTFGLSGTTTQVPVVPEPVSSLLFVIGGATLGGRIWAGRKK